MSYILNKTDGTILIELVDGILDSDTTDISLVGKNFTGYGEFINENFVKILENFANSTVPLSPLKGQLWYDTSVDKLKIYNGTEFLPAAGSFVGPFPPQNPISGDTWYNSFSNQLSLYDGDEFRLVGPQFTLQQGQSGIFVRTVQDINFNSRTVLELRIGTTLQAVISREEITPDPSTGNIIQELVDNVNNPEGIIYPGVNVVNSYDFVYQGTATRAQNLITGSDFNSEFSTQQVLRNDQDGNIRGNLTLQGNSVSGTQPELILSSGSGNSSLLYFDKDLTITTGATGDDIRLIVSRVAGTTTEQFDAITVISQDKRVGIFNSSPEYNLDVNGDARVTGDLTVDGATVAVNTTDLFVAAKNINLGAVANPDDTTADAGGIILKGGPLLTDTNNDKTFTWIEATESWTSSENIELAASKMYRINNQPVLSSTRLFDNVTQATGLTRVGTLTELTVDDIAIDDNTISRINGSGLTINPNNGNIDVVNNKITNVELPTQNLDATNKTYVDIEIEKALLVFSIDVTGWTVANTNGNLIKHLNVVSPPRTQLNGKEASIITTRITSQVIEGINVAAGTNIEYADVLVGPDDSSIPVDFSDVGKLTVVEAISLPSNLSVPYTPIIAREVRHFIINSGSWIANVNKPPESVPNIL